MSHITTNKQLSTYINQNLYQLLDTPTYLYHSVGGCNLDKLISILSTGILSWDEGKRRGIEIQSQGLGYNGSNFVSVSTHEVLDRKGYSGKDLSLIIDPKDLNFKHISQSDAELIPFFEKQIYQEVPQKNLVGITIPPNYLDPNFSNSQLFYIGNCERLKHGIESLNKFYLNTTKVSLLADPKLQSIFTKALTFHSEREKMRKETPSILEYVSKSGILEEETQTEFNTTLIARMKNIFTELTNKASPSLFDLVHFHTKGAYPIYLTTGERII